MRAGFIGSFLGHDGAQLYAHTWTAKSGRDPPDSFNFFLSTPLFCSYARRDAINQRKHPMKTTRSTMALLPHPHRLISSQSSRPPSVRRRSSARTPTRSFKPGGPGPVARPFGRNAAVFTDGNGTAISKREARSLVVCGTTVM